MVPDNGAHVLRGALQRLHDARRAAGEEDPEAAVGILRRSSSSAGEQALNLRALHQFDHCAVTNASTLFTPILSVAVVVDSGRRSVRRGVTQVFSSIFIALRIRFSTRVSPQI